MAAELCRQRSSRPDSVQTFSKSPRTYMAMDVRHAKIMFLLLPLLVYAAVMYRMIDSSTCEIEGHVGGPHVHVGRSNNNDVHTLRVNDNSDRQANAVDNNSHVLEMLARRY
jgi:hypothetical protein